MVDVNLSLENIAPFPRQHEHAAVQGIPWNQIMGWYRITTADVNRILGADDPCALTAAAIVVSFGRHDQLKKSIPEGQLTTAEETGNNSCGRLAAVVKPKIDNEKPTVKFCDILRSGGSPMTFPLPFEWNDKAFTVRPSVAAGVCKFFRDYGCVANDFEVAYSGNDNLDEFGDGHFNRMISFSRCEGAGSREETQIERPPTESQEISGVHVCESDRFSPSCRRFPVADGDCDIRAESQPFIAPDSWYKSCAIGSLTFDVQLANVDWAGSDDRLFLEIGHSSKWDGGEPHSLLKTSPDKGDKMTKEINLKDAFDKSPITPGDIKHVGLASRVDHGGLGTDELKLQGMCLDTPQPGDCYRIRGETNPWHLLDMTLRLRCAGTNITAEVRKTNDSWLTFWAADIRPTEWAWDLCS
ncbi:hypothetical protein MAC_08725 [Metarhizium acridum CQMa 102]|uniref:Uncharacterized protein n=1 Tax=Metarhizium acridum (strain CQMa 102) TaxID=655827 RepID=E9EFS7_METAQ|nr:uncharacterized protein MAC_08725 [Metarhizium acridum CQMa 102]EFY85214.1 hypothetical protein MAC_08725 [Metarhizium acridum CQMa 102]